MVAFYLSGARIEQFCQCSCVQCIRQYFAAQIHFTCQGFANSIESRNDLEWKQNFCVSRETFRCLCTALQPRFQHTGILREVITMEKRIGIALWRLGTNVEYRTIFHLFDVGLSSAIVNEVCNSGCSASKYIQLPLRKSSNGQCQWICEQMGLPTVLSRQMARTFLSYPLLITPRSTTTERRFIRS